MSHEDFKVISDAEFRDRYPAQETVMTSAGPLPVQPEAQALRKPNELARQAASLAWRIEHEHPDPAAWKAELAAAPAELRECLREYLLQRYKALQDRRRREAEGGKKSPKGDEAIAELAKRYGV